MCEKSKNNFIYCKSLYLVEISTFEQKNKSHLQEKAEHARPSRLITRPDLA